MWNLNQPAMKYLFVSLALLFSASACSKKDNESAQTYTVDGPGSKVEWKGSAPDHFHIGSFAVSGELRRGTGGEILEGKFRIPIASIENYDLPDDVKPQLLDHLKSPDFFNMALYPDATFEIARVTPYGKPSADTTHTIQGAFTMLGKTNTISFPARITVENGNLTTKASFVIDRLKWGMTSYNDPAQGLYILPEIEIKLDILAKK